MTVYQLPVEVAAFMRWLTGLTSRARPEGGWYGVFAARDPEGLRACSRRILTRHVLPNIAEPLILTTAQAMGGALLGL
ncbi:hypothetical protein ABZ318_34170, partial [Streptomyces sp. NPDC006197]